MSTVTSAGLCLTVSLLGLRSTSTAVTSTGSPTAVVSSSPARVASWRARGMWCCSCPATISVPPATQTDWPEWFLVLSVKTPAGPISTWSMSADAFPTGMACSTVHAGPSWVRSLPTAISPTAPLNHGRASSPQRPTDSRTGMSSAARISSERWNSSASAEVRNSTTSTLCSARAVRTSSGVA